MVVPTLHPIADINDAGAVAATGLALRHDGFAVVPDVFPREAVREVERLLDQAFVVAARTPGAQKFLVRYPTNGAQHGGGLDAWDQLELNHAAGLMPELLKTAVFRSCTALARRLAGPVSHSFDHAIYKGAHNRTATPWHQDAAFTLWRRSQSRQLHFWIPLQDVSRESGCMTFLAGSHRAPMLHHRRVLRQSGRLGREALPDTDGCIACPVAVGGLTIHTPATLHCAGRNESAVPRKAWILQYGLFGQVRLTVKRLAGTLPTPLREEGARV
jgi:hypothetical protein